MDPAAEFLIEKPEFDAASATARFRFSLGHHRFVETLTFAPGFNRQCTSGAGFLQALDIAACALGVSYFKLLAPTRIKAPGIALTSRQREFVLDIYQNGLGEFYARNDLNRFGRLQLVTKTAATPPAPDFGLSQKNLLLIGGGKDSLVSVQLMETAGEDFTPFAVNPKGPIVSSIKKIGKEPLFVKRALDPYMIELGTRPGYYNGHVPSTAINSMIATLAALMFDFGRIILSNERSASEANRIHDGRPVNHQHSKSYDFECLMAEMLSELTAGKLKYFSLLRPYSELRIARIFSSIIRFDTVFSSCNANFRLRGNNHRLWCGTCPKCLFVFLIFAPFMDRQRLVAIFGVDILDNPANLPTFRQLSGLTGHKPWECVGQTMEAATCLFKLTGNNYWNKSALIARLGAEVEARYGAEKLVEAWQELMKYSPNNKIPPALAKRIGDAGKFKP